MKQKYLINGLVVLSVFCVSFMVASQPAFAITGQVLDQNGKEYVGATVTMNYNGTLTTQKTTSSGYSFIDPCPFAQNGQPGSAPYTLTLTVPSGYTATTPTTANATSTRGEFQQNGTGCGQMMVNGVWKHYPTSSTPDPINFGISSAPPANCTTTPINCSACTAPANTCSNGNGTQTCTLSQPQTCSNVSRSQSCTLNNCNVGNTCTNQVCQPPQPPPNCTTTPINCSACIAPANTCSNGNGTQTCTLSQPQTCSNVSRSQSCTLNNCNAGNNCTNQVCQPPPNCTTTPINCSVCTAPANTCSNGNGTQTCTLSQPQTCSNVSRSQSCTLNNCNAGNNCTNQVCQPPTYTITGHVFIDTNDDGINNDNDPYTGGITITGSGGTVTTNAAAGTYTISNVTAGAYTITYTSLPSGYFMTYPTNNPISFTVTVGGSCTVNGAKNATCNANNIQNLDFGIHPLYTISGNIFVDPNKNGLIDAGETNYAVKPTITASQATVTTAANGSYTITNIPQNTTVTVSYTSLPIGYYMTSPLNGPPPSYAVTVGTACTVNGAKGATCTAGNIQNLNFGVSNLTHWWQATCSDVRQNNIVDMLPAGADALIAATSCSNTPGLPFSGNTTATFGQGQASTTNQIVGSSLYPEVYPTTSSLATSYTSLLAKAQGSGITPITLASVCNLTNCTLPANLPHGIYSASGNVNLNAFTFPANQNYVFLISGTLTLQGAITVPIGSSALFATATNDNIVVTPTVGTAATSTASSLDGWFIAGQSFIVNSQGNCNDLRLNIAGAVVVNALGNGGTFTNNRDLCGADTTDPTVSFTQRLDMLLNAPSFIQQQQTLSQEVNP